MVKLAVQKKIVSKAFKEHPQPFLRQGDSFHWSGDTDVKSKATARTYHVIVEVAIRSDPRHESELSACLCQPEGVRFDDLTIVTMIDPKLKGRISLRGLPKNDAEHDLAKFVKKVNEGDGSSADD